MGTLSRPVSINLNQMLVERDKGSLPENPEFLPVLVYKTRKNVFNHITTYKTIENTTRRKQQTLR